MSPAPFTQAFLLIFAALFPIINPIGDAPIFLLLTRMCSRDERHALARKVAINSFFLLLSAMIFGGEVLAFFGVQVPFVQLGGGIVVSTLAWKLLNTTARAPTDNPIAPTAPEAFYPLTMPLTVGPGTLAVAITLGGRASSHGDVTSAAALIGAAAASAVAICLAIYACYRFGESLVLLIGADGVGVVVRLSAFLSLCIGLQLAWAGWRALSSVQ